MITYYIDMNSKVGERGQITIPKTLRDRLGIRPGQSVEFEELDGSILIRKRLPRDPVDAVYGVLRSFARSSDEVVAQLRDEDLPS